MLENRGRYAFVLLEEARQVSLRREAQPLGHLFQRRVRGCEHGGYLADDALVDNGLGRTAADAPAFHEKRQGRKKLSPTIGGGREAIPGED